MSNKSSIILVFFYTEPISLFDKKLEERWPFVAPYKPENDIKFVSLVV